MSKRKKYYTPTPTFHQVMYFFLEGQVIYRNADDGRVRVQVWPTTGPQIYEAMPKAKDCKISRRHASKLLREQLEYQESAQKIGRAIREIKNYNGI